MVKVLLKRGLIQFKKKSEKYIWQFTDPRKSLFGLTIIKELLLIYQIWNQSQTSGNDFECNSTTRISSAVINI